MGKSLKAYATETWVLKKIADATKRSGTVQVVNGGGSAGGLKINRDLTKEEYMVLLEEGKTEPNTLYLFKKVVNNPTE